jgi:hypothetical protein
MLGSIALTLLLAGIGTTAEPSRSAEQRDLTTASSPHIPSQSGGDEEEIEKLKGELRLPGPEARPQRESAIAALLGMKSLSAHRALQDVLTSGEDPDGLQPAILTQLVPKLRNRRDAVFGDIDKDPVKRVRASYVRPLVLLVGRQEPPPVKAVADRARDALLALASWERVPVFREMLADPDRGVRLAAAVAAGSCQDLSLARVLGDAMADPDADVQNAVQQSLVRLTYCHSGFASKAALDTWFEQLGEKSFVDLAEQTALAAHEAQAAERQRADAAVRELVLEVVQSYVERVDMRWKDIQRRVFAPQPAEITMAALDRLRTLLASNEKLTGAAPDRLAFLDKLLEMLSAAESAGRVQDQSILLELCAYLVGPTEDQQRAALADRLFAGLTSDHVAVRMAALAGLRRFPSEPNRHRVVQIAREALGARRVAELEAALTTLNAKDWSAPSPEGTSYANWLRLLQDTIHDQALPLPVRTQALRTLDRRDDRKLRVDEGFDILAEVVRDENQDASLREFALMQLAAGSYVTDAERGEKYVQLLEACLADSVARIRARTAERIHEIPDSLGKDHLEAWTRRLLEAARPRLLEELDESIQQTLAENMRRTAEQRVAPEFVIGQLCKAADELAAAPSALQQPFRRRNLADALRILAAPLERPLSQWLRAGEALLVLGERDALRSVLQRHEEGKNGWNGDAPPDLAQRARVLVVRCAMLRSDAKTWNDADNIAEAHQVLDAVNKLVLTESLPPENSITLLRIAIHGDLGQPEAVLKLAASLATTGADADPTVRHQVAMRSGEALLALGRPIEARDRLVPLADNGAVAPEVLALLESVGEALLSKREFVAAEQVGALLVKRTADGSPRCPARLLLHAEALYQVDPRANAAAVGDMLDQKRAVFARDDTPAQVRQRFEALLSRVRGNS